jgi:hypothetical protein
MRLTIPAMSVIIKTLAFGDIPAGLFFVYREAWEKIKAVINDKYGTDESAEYIYGKTFGAARVSNEIVNTAVEVWQNPSPEIINFVRAAGSYAVLTFLQKWVDAASNLVFVVIDGAKAQPVSARRIHVYESIRDAYEGFCPTEDGSIYAVKTIMALTPSLENDEPETEPKDELETKPEDEHQDESETESKDEPKNNKLGYSSDEMDELDKIDIHFRDERKEPAKKKLVKRVPVKGTDIPRNKVTNALLFFSYMLVMDERGYREKYATMDARDLADKQCSVVRKLGKEHGGSPERYIRALGQFIWKHTLTGSDKDKIREDFREWKKTV